MVPRNSDSRSAKRTANRAWCQYTSPAYLSLCLSCTSRSEKLRNYLLDTQMMHDDTSSWAVERKYHAKLHVHVSYVYPLNHMRQWTVKQQNRTLLRSISYIPGTWYHTPGTRFSSRGNDAYIRVGVRTPLQYLGSTETQSILEKRHV